MRPIRSSVVTLAALAPLALGCAGAEEEPVTLAQLQQSIFTPSCSFGACHGGLNPKNGLDLSTLEASYASLLGEDGAGTARVIPGDPDGSLLLLALEGPVLEVRQMPLGFSLPAAAIEQVRAWIASGAPKGVEGQPPGRFIPPDAVAPDLPRPEDLSPPEPHEGFQMAIDAVAPAASEIWKCLVADLPTTELSPIHRVESLQSRGVHHMDVMALGLLDLPIEPGMYDCDELYGTWAEMMEEGIFLFATQNERETLTLPDGVVALVPAGLRVMVEIHYVNPTQRDVEVFSRVNAYTIPLEEMTDAIWGSAVRKVEIDIPPQTERHYEWVRCEMNRDIELLILSSHTHQLAEYVDVFLWDGEQRGAMIYDTDDWHAPVLQQFDPPLPIAAGTGFELRCHYRNPTEEWVRWGFGADDEMCQIGIVHTPMDFDAACVITEQGSGPTLP